MPRVKLDYVVSFSSEDSENQANNLLAHEVSKKKWLCCAGEPSCSVVFQLARAVQITTVQIGACHAALVEVLVGRSEKPNDQFEVLVPSSVFLSPLESRKDSGTEKVRSFTGDQLSAARERRWDRIRVVCSQPYNKHCKYGLSFIHIFEPEDKTRPEQKPPVAPAVPRRMTLVDNFSSDEDDFKPGEMFAKHQQRISEGGSDTGAQIRQATSKALKNISNSSTKLVKTPITKNSTNLPNQSNHVDKNRQKDSLMYTDDDEQPHSKIDAVINRHKNEKEIEAKKEQPKKQDAKVRKHEANSSLFKDFLDDDKKKDSSNSRSKDTSKDRRKDFDSSRSKNNGDDGRNDLNSSRSKDSSRDERRKDLNNSRNHDDRRNRDEDRTPSRNNTDDSQNRDSKKRPHSDEKAKSKDALKPGGVSSSPHRLLAGVVFALSGYENPRRAALRDAAVAMGARFLRDWTPACTHLICAFPNTPKLRTVRASQSPCIAVLGEWVEGCCERRRLLPWQWFATEPKLRVAAPATLPEEASGDSTECDTDDEIEKVLRKQKRQRVNSSPSPNRDVSPQPHCSKGLSPQPHCSKDIPKTYNSRDISPKPHTSSEKIEKSPKLNRSREDTSKRQNTSNVSNISTDSDVVFTKAERFQGNVTIDSDSDETDEEKPVPKERVDRTRVLPEIFEGYTFVIDDAVERYGFDAQLLARYVKAYGGVVVDASQLDGDSEVSYVVSAGAADNAPSSGQRVRPDWVWRCHQRKTLCDTDEFAL